MFSTILVLLLGAGLGIGALFLLIEFDWQWFNPNSKALRDFDKNPQDWKEVDYQGFWHKSGLILLSYANIKTFAEKQEHGNGFSVLPVELTHSDGQGKRYTAIIKSRKDKLARANVKLALEGERAVVQQKKKEEKLGYFEAKKVKTLGTF